MRPAPRSNNVRHEFQQGIGGDCNRYPSKQRQFVDCHGRNYTTPPAGSAMALRWLLGFALLLTPLCSAQQTYSTKFPLTENPICEGGHWQNGKTNGSGACSGLVGGIDWNDMATSPGFVYNVNGSGFADGTAVLTGVWGPTQYVRGVAKCNGADTNPEIELRLRSTITAHNINGYEIDLACNSGAGQFIAVVRWNGPVNNFFVLTPGNSFGVSTGDVVEAWIVGCNITVKVNYKQLFPTVSDCTFAGGAPGIGSEQTAGPSTDQGWTSFYASDSLPWLGVIDPSRAIDWRNAGLPSSYADGETTVNGWTPPTGRTQSGSTINCTNSAGDVTAINAAIAAASPATYVLVNGTCSIPSDLVLRKNFVTLRGTGPMSTTLNLTGASTRLQYGVCCTGGGTANLSATSYPIGTTTFTVTGASCGASCGTLVAGNYASITECNSGWSGTPCAGSYSDPWPAGPTPILIAGRDDFPLNANGTGSPNGGTPNGPNHDQQQNFLLTNVVNNGGGSYTVTVTPGFYANTWTSNRTAQLTWQQQSNMSFGVGVEDLTVKCQFNQAEKWEFSNTYGSWQKGVRNICGSQNTFNQWGNARNIMVNSYVHAEDPVNSLSQISEPTAFFNTSDSLVLNNILTGGLCLWGEGGRTGDVFAYNYCRDAQSPDYQVISEDHGVSDLFTLHEGNMLCKIQHDWTHGTHDLFTDYRNYLCGGDDPYWSTNATSFQIDWYNRFGNIIKNSIFGRGGAYQSQGPGSGAVFSMGNTVPGFPSLSDALLIPGTMRWGNTSNVTQGSDTPANSGLRYVTSEVPVTLTGNAVGYQNAVPATHDSACSFFLPVGTSPCVPLTSGGTGLSWWKVCTSWSSFPTCAGSTTPRFPSVGPENTGGLYISGTVYDNPSAVAWKHLPIDTFYQQSYTVTTSTWSNNPAVCGPITGAGTGAPAASGNNPCMILGVVVGASAEHLMGGFQLCLTMVAGVCTVPLPSGCYPASGPSSTLAWRSDNEILITASNPTQVAYSLAADPGANACVGTNAFRFPDVRQFDERIYQADGGSSGPPVNAPASVMFMTSNETSEPVRGHLQ